MSTFPKSQSDNGPVLCVNQGQNLYLLDKPSECATCAYSRIGTGFCPDWSPPNPKLAVLCEAAGSNEIIDREPLVGAAGWVFTRNFLFALGYTRSDVMLCNTLRCFTSAKAMIYTPSGYQQWRLLNEGDKVLTHLGRFKPIKKKLTFTSGPRVRISYKTTFGHRTFIVTDDHLFLCGNKWVQAKDLRSGEEITVLGECCAICDTPFARQIDSQFKNIPFCSTKCHNVYNGIKGKASFSASMLTQYQRGVRDRHGIVAEANKITRDLVMAGQHNLQHLSDEQRHKSRVSSAVTRSLMNSPGRGFIGRGEDDLAEILSAAGYEFDRQFPIERYNYDFRVGNVLLEVDGPGTLNASKSKLDRDVLKQALAEEKGFNVVHVPYIRLDEALSYLDNDQHNYVFVSAQVLSVEPLPARGNCYTLQIADDESYIGLGTVAHNCHPPDNMYPTGELRRNAERSCRIYDSRAGKTMSDNGLNDFNPDTYLITMHPSAVNRTWSLLRVVQNDMAKAFRLAEQGRRVLVLMGDKAMNLVVPHIPSVSKWRGHYGQLNWADFRGRYD